MYCFNIAFCSTTYVQPLSHLSLWVLSLSYFHTSLSPTFHTSLSPFFSSLTHALSHTIFIALTWGSLRAKHCQFYCLLFFNLREYFSSYMNAGTSSPWRTSVQPFSSFLRTSVLPCTASTLLSVQTPTFGSFLNFLYWVLSNSYFSHFVVTYFSYFAFTFFSSLTHALSHTIFHCSYLMKPLGETLSILLSVVL